MEKEGRKEESNGPVKEGSKDPVKKEGEEGVGYALKAPPFPHVSCWRLRSLDLFLAWKQESCPEERRRIKRKKRKPSIRALMMALSAMISLSNALILSSMKGLSA